MNVQIIENNGEPEWAVVPYDEYRRMVEALEDKADAATLDAAARRLSAGEEESLPAEMVARLLEESPYRVWREYRGLTLENVAAAAGVTRGYVSMIESGKRQPSRPIQARIARALDVLKDELDQDV